MLADAPVEVPQRWHRIGLGYARVCTFPQSVPSKLLILNINGLVLQVLCLTFTHAFVSECVSMSADWREYEIPSHFDVRFGTPVVGSRCSCRHPWTNFGYFCGPG